jgi:hypothetical protein
MVPTGLIGSVVTSARDIDARDIDASDIYVSWSAP